MMPDEKKLLISRTIVINEEGGAIGDYIGMEYSSKYPQLITLQQGGNNEISLPVKHARSFITEFEKLIASLEGDK